MSVYDDEEDTEAYDKGYADGYNDLEYNNPFLEDSKEYCDYKLGFEHGFWNS